MIARRMLFDLFFLSSCAFGDRELFGCPDDFVCHNGGRCDSDGRCNCTLGWTGEQCERELCPTSPCVNGYCSTTEAGQKICLCDHRFEGRYCELDRDECSQRPCPSDATCVNHVPRDRMDKGFSCLCPTGYTGEFCEIEVDLCDVYKKQGENYCENEGICEARYVCICQDGFGGSRCSHRVPYFSEYEKFGCLERPEVCAKVFDNGHCDEVCNRESCLFDGFDCVNRGFVCRNPSGCAYKYGDGNCDQECAGAECGFDGGDCNDSKNMSHNQNVNMIGVALALPPDVAVKSLRQLQSELAQHLYTHVGIARDVDGVMVYEWSADHGEGSRVVFGEEVARVVNTNASGTIIFFDVDTSACRLKSRKSSSQPHCFTDIRAAATYLTLELTRFSPISGDTLPIRDITWKEKQLNTFKSWSFPVILVLILLVVMVVVVASCMAIFVILVRSRRKRRKTIFAPCWRIPGCYDCTYQPPTPPYSGSPKNDTDQRKCDSKAIADSLPLTIDAEPSLLSVIRRSDVKAVKEMISSKEFYEDAVDDNGLGPLHHAIANNDAEMLKLLIGCGEFDLFERNDAGQSPLVYAARMAHPGIECISILVSAITTFRKHHHDDVLSDHFSNIGASRRQLIKSLPLHDEANVRYALTDAMGRNVIHYAALNNAPHLVHYFATCGANVNLVDNHGDAPIHLAARGGNVEAVAALILNNCDMSVRDASERTAYTVADLQGYSLVCELFNKAQNVSCN